MFTRFLSRLNPIALIAFCGMVYLLTFFMLPRDYFWITDNDNKFLQTQAILSSGYTKFSIPWPGQNIDPEFRYNPLPSPFSQVYDGKLYSIFSPVFATLSSVPYELFGFMGLYLFPLIGTLALLWGISRIGAILALPLYARNAAVLLAGLGTPLWFYSIVFWEHTIAVAFCVWAVYWLLRYAEKPTFDLLWRGSILAAIGVYFRDDLYLFCLVFALAAAYANAGDRLKTAVTAGAVMVAAIIPLWFFQGLTIGHPFGFHLGAHMFTIGSISEYLTSRPQVFYNLFMAAHPNKIISALITLPLLLLLLLPGRIFRKYGAAAPIMALGGGLLLAIVSLGGFFLAGSPIQWLLQTNSLLPAAPVLILASGAFLPKVSSYGPRGLPLLRAVAVSYLILYALAAPVVGSTGIHWGNRFVLILYPLFALLAVSQVSGVIHGAGKWKSATDGMLAALVVISLAAQVFSCTLLEKKLDFNRRLTQAVAARPEQAVITDVWWAPQTLSRLFYREPIFYTRSQTELQELGQQLVSQGVSFVLYITPAGTRSPTGNTQRIEDNGLGFFSLDLVPLELRRQNRPVPPR